ncbi:MAG TPA: hypothetical protein VF813_01675, partial [Anaerolineaceae bacterium]
IRGIDRSEAVRLMNATPMPSREDEIREIRRVYGPTADGVIRAQEAFLDLDEEGYSRLQARIADRWDEVQAATATVPPADEVRQLLRQANLPTDPAEIHLTEEDVRDAILYGHYIRNPFTVIKLSRVLGINWPGD